MSTELQKKQQPPGYQNYGIESLSTQQLMSIYQAAQDAGTSQEFLELIKSTIRKRSYYRGLMNTLSNSDGSKK